jgi:RNA polymerase sigma-70 factor (ECF subfamily)
MEVTLSIAYPELVCGSFVTSTRATDKASLADASRSAAAIDFDTVYREQRARVLGAVRGVIGASDEVEDVVQLAFLEVYRCLPRFEGRSKLSTWVYRIAINVALQHVRRTRRKRWLTLGATGEEVSREPSGFDADARLQDRDMLRLVQKAASHLTDKKRSVWALHELEGLDPREIAEILDIPMNTVRSRLLAARQEVMEHLGRSCAPGGGKP